MSALFSAQLDSKNKPIMANFSIALAASVFQKKNSELKTAASIFVKKYEIGICNEWDFARACTEAKELCTLEANTFKSAETLNQIASAKAHWSESLLELGKAIPEIQALNEKQARLLAAVASSQHEWFEDVKFFEMSVEQRKDAFLESPIFYFESHDVV